MYRPLVWCAGDAQHVLHDLGVIPVGRELGLTWTTDAMTVTAARPIAIKNVRPPLGADPDVCVRWMITALCPDGFPAARLVACLIASSEVTTRVRGLSLRVGPRTVRSITKRRRMPVRQARQPVGKIIDCPRRRESESSGRFGKSASR
jgi:hypothetical protein